MPFCFEGRMLIYHLGNIFIPLHFIQVIGCWLSIILTNQNAFHGYVHCYMKFIFGVYYSGSLIIYQKNSVFKALNAYEPIIYVYVIIPTNHRRLISDMNQSQSVFYYYSSHISDVRFPTYSNVFTIIGLLLWFFFMSMTSRNIMFMYIVMAFGSRLLLWYLVISLNVIVMYCFVGFNCVGTLLLWYVFESTI